MINYGINVVIGDRGIVLFIDCGNIFKEFNLREIILDNFRLKGLDRIGRGGGVLKMYIFVYRY